jgi:hypothetical protein
MKNFLIFLSFFFVVILSIMFETTQISFPFIFSVCLFLLIFFKKNFIFLIVLILGIISDSLRVTFFGITPLLVFLTFGIILLYEYYSGSKDMLVSLLLIFTSIIVYSFIFSYSIFYVLLISFVFTIFLLTFNFFKKEKEI